MEESKTFVLSPEMGLIEKGCLYSNRRESVCIILPRWEGGGKIEVTIRRMEERNEH